jgi:DNA mismatch repair ATPase MutS
MVLTGANASGKSVYARQLGIICFLAMVGSNVPAKRAAVPLLDAILCLDAQSSIAKGVSLRSSQCAQLQKVVDVATKDSLVIVDELGTGLGH